MAEPSELNLWTRQWRDELIRKARGDFRKYDAAWQGLQEKSTDYARSIRMARDVCAEVLAVWEASQVDLPAGVLAVDQRQAFEAWAAREGYPVNRERFDADVYQDPRTHAAWWAWKEARGVQEVDRG